MSFLRNVVSASVSVTCTRALVNEYMNGMFLLESKCANSWLAVLGRGWKLQVVAWIR